MPRKTKSPAKVATVAGKLKFRNEKGRFVSSKKVYKTIKDKFGIESEMVDDIYYKTLAYGKGNSKSVFEEFNKRLALEKDIAETPYSIHVDKRDLLEYFKRERTYKITYEGRRISRQKLEVKAKRVEAEISENNNVKVVYFQLLFNYYPKTKTYENVIYKEDFEDQIQEGMEGVEIEDGFGNAMMTYGKNKDKEDKFTPRDYGRKKFARVQKRR